jgi:hypothetical protein
MPKYNITVHLLLTSYSKSTKDLSDYLLGYSAVYFRTVNRRFGGTALLHAGFLLGSLFSLDLRPCRSSGVVASFPPRRTGFELGSGPVGCVVEKSGIWAGFLRGLRFTLPLIPQTPPHSSSIIRGWYNRPNSDRRTKRTRSHPTQTLQNPDDGGRFLRNVG